MNAEPLKVSDAAPSPVAATAAPSGPVAAPAPAAEPASLTPYQKRKAREAERERLREERRASRAARSPGKAPAAAAEPAAAEPAPVTDPGIPYRDSDVRLRDLALAWRVLWRVFGFVAGFVGYDLEPLTEKEAGEDARAFLPIAERFAVVDRAVTWAAAPFVLVERVAGKLHRRPPEAPKA
ncbi:MAG: hypothetical protein IPO08_21835 [Xanthomonadales bacterium]|nr:hypothetical protein [Xanthomonadales bacterium]